MICIKYYKGHIAIDKIGPKLKKKSEINLKYYKQSTTDICNAIIAS